MKHKMKMKKIVKERVDYNKSVFVFLSKKERGCQTSHILFEIESRMHALLRKPLMVHVHFSHTSRSTFSNEVQTSRGNPLEPCCYVLTWLDHDFQVSSNINCLLTKRIEQTGINFLLIFPKLKRQDLTTSRRLHFQFNLRSNPCPLHALLKKTTLTAFIGARALFEHIMRYFSRSKFRVEIPLTMLVHLDMTRLLI